MSATQKKSSAKKTTKRKPAAKKNPLKKGKVTVSGGSLIILCGSVIIGCLFLLLGTMLIESRPKTAISFADNPVVSEKTENKEEIKVASKTEVKIEEKTKTVTSTKTENKTSTNVAPKTEENKTVKTEASGGATKTPQQSSSKTKSEELKKAPDPKPAASTPVAEGGRPKVEETKTESKVTPKNTGFDFPQAVNHAQLCILLDDGGQNLDDLQKFLALKIPVTVAVLPKLRDSVSSAKAVRASGYAELMLHQPMQAVNMNVNPGPGAITPEMSSTEIRNMFMENLNQIGPVSGANNHEGSLITADALKMETVLRTASEQGIYFLDSRTNVETKIPYVSREMGYGWYERNGYFLDNQKTREEFLKELRKNLDIANKTGCVIMIAHVWSADYMPALIREVYPELVAKGYSFTTVGKSRGLKN